jgi:Bifunctional DNA primase/polymerase, N-terminal/Family of unknown function (DUF5906)/Primase C terminal 1 (PriCT-1)
VNTTPRFADVAAQLTENGYSPVPLHFGQKRPCAGDGWQHYRFTETDTERFAHAGVGILCGKVVGLDIDVRDPKLAAELDALAEQMFGPAPKRVGQAPKVLRVLQAIAPFSKIVSRSYRLNGDGPDEKIHRVEILATGQQFVAYNIHPDTGQPYTWNGVGDPRTVPIGCLPVITEQSAREFVAAAEKLLAQYGRAVGGDADQHDGDDVRDEHHVGAGGRNEALSREAFRLRKQGASVEEIVAILRAFNGARCRPPLPDQEVVAIAEGKARVEPQPAGSVTLEDFYAYMPMHQYVFVPSRELWPPSSVNARVPAPPGPDGKPMKPAQWLDEHRPVDQMTWAPGEPKVIQDRLVSNGGWIERTGCACFNLYLPPNPPPGDAEQATRWLDHVRRIYPDNADHIVRWLAHRVQRPGEKINHALVLGGAQGIGKDTILEPVKHAVGPWNFVEVSPSHLLGRFNGFVKSVILRISEARDLGDVDRYSFYDHTKVYTAAPPDVLRCDEKHIREHSVMNVTGVIITSNHKSDGIYLPADDRRHYIAWSEWTKEDFDDRYWRDLYGWYQSGGCGHVAAYLSRLDLSEFNPKAPPPKTPAFWDIVDANRAPEDAELADVIEALGDPAALTVGSICIYASEDFRDWLTDRRNRRQIPHRLEAANYVAVRNDSADDGLWKVAGKRMAIYARSELPVRDRIAAAARLCREGRQ